MILYHKVNIFTIKIGQKEKETENFQKYKTKTIIEMDLKDKAKRI